MKLRAFNLAPDKTMLAAKAEYDALYQAAFFCLTFLRSFHRVCSGEVSIWLHQKWEKKNMARPAVQPAYISPEDYFAREKVAEYKSEYYNGEIFAMTGGVALRDVYHKVVWPEEPVRA